jgi:glycosyltransferase involved in cell wall biosynthesis
MGLDVLIEAAALVQKALPEVMMLIAGTGHAEAELEARIAERKLEGHVRLLGFVAEDDLPLLYAAADLSVLPSLALEGFGLAIVESMAAGTPTVGTPVGGIPEVLRPFRPGLISADATPQALGETLTRLLTGAEPAPDPDDCRRYAARFGWDTVFPHILDVWRESGARMA